MPDYLKRTGELITRLQELEPKLPENERPKVRQALFSYFDARKAALDDLQKLLDDVGAATDKENQWRDRVGRMRDDLNRYIGDLLSGLSDPSPGLFAFRALVLNDENRFWEGLKEIKVAEKRDQITAIRLKLEALATELEEKWRTVESNDSSIDEREKAIYQQMQENFRVGLNAVSAAHGTMKEQVAAAVLDVLDWKKKISPGGITGSFSVSAAISAIKYLLELKTGFAVSTAQKVAKEALRAYLQMNEDFKRRVAEYRSLVANEGGVLILYGRTYKDTQEFIRTNGFDQAKELYPKANDSLNSWSSAQASGGCRDDAEQFAHDALERLSWVLARTEASFNDCVSRHRGKFYGPVDPGTKEMLCEFKEWEDRLNNLKGMSVETQLRQYRDDAKNVFLIDIDTMVAKSVDDLRSEANTLVLPMFNRPNKEIILTITGSDADDLAEAYKFQCSNFVGQIRAEIEALVRSAEEAGRELTPEELQKALDRQLLPGLASIPSEYWDLVKN